MSREINELYEFGPFRLNVNEHKLERIDGSSIGSLPEKAFQTLCILVRNGGHLLAKRELIEQVWPDSFVEDNNLDKCIHAIRHALGDKPGEKNYIETVRKHGYRFVAGVNRIVDESCVPIDPSIKVRLTPRRPIWSFAELISEMVRRRFVFLSTSLMLLAFFSIGIGVWQVNRSDKNSRFENIRSIAVLPFEMIDPSREARRQDFGLTDLLITRLSNIRDLKVRPTSAVLSLENNNFDIMEAARDLKVDAVLTGTIYRSANNVRVSTRLLLTESGAAIWVGQFEKPLKDELRIHDEIALQIVDVLTLNLTGAETAAPMRPPTDSPDAYQLYLKGRYHWNKRNREGLAEAERLFRNAIEKDPNFALAYVGLADVILQKDKADEAFHSIEKALELDPNLAEAHATKGFIYTFYKWQWREAEDSFKKSIALNPGYATAHHWFATLMMIEGRSDEAKMELQRALEINPFSHNFLADLGQAHYFAGEYDEARRYCLESLEIYPDFLFAHLYLLDIYVQTGEFSSAVNEYSKSVRLQTPFTGLPVEQQADLERHIADAAAAFERGGGEAFFRQRIADGSRDLTAVYGLAQFHAFLHENQKSLDYLEKGYHARTFLMPFVKVDPAFKNLREEPRYTSILDKMGLR